MDWHSQSKRDLCDGSFRSGCIKHRVNLFLLFVLPVQSAQFFWGGAYNGLWVGMRSMFTIPGYAPTFFFARCGTYFFSMQPRRSEPKLKIWNTANHPVCLWNVLVVTSSIDPIFLQTHSFIGISLRINCFWYLFHLGIAERDTYSQY